MPAGGARNRSGPQRDPNSLRSTLAGYSLTALPAQGYDGESPPFPLPATPAAEREAEIWAWVWRTPQAAAWISESWRWHAIAMWVRQARICESEDASAADKALLTRFADQIGMTPAGLKENGWKIASDEVGRKRADKPAAPSTRSRLSAVRSATDAG